MSLHQLRQAADALFPDLINAHDKAQVLMAVRASAGTSTNVAKERQLLAEEAKRIASFEEFLALALEDLREAYLEDRANKTRRAKYRRLSWLTLFKYFAKARGIEQALVIRALDRQGNYECELVDRGMPGSWGKFVKLAAVCGIPEEELFALYRQSQQERAKRV